MAIGSFEASTIAAQLPGISDAIINDSCLMRYLRDNKRIFYNEGGSSYDFRVKYQSASNGGFSADWAANNVSTQQPFKKLTTTPRQWNFRIISSTYQEDRNKNAGAEAKMFSQLAEDLNSMKQDAADHFATALYGTNGTTQTGDNGTPINGLEDVIDDNNTHCGENRSTSTWWQAQVDSRTLANFFTDTGSTGRVDGIGWMESIFLDCSQGKDSSSGIGSNLATKKDSPDYILTTQTIFDDYQEALYSSFRYQGTTADSYKKVYFHGAEVEWDTYCTANRMYFLNKKYLCLYVVNDKLLKPLKTIETVSPLGTVHVIGGQGQFFTKNSRYLGAIQFS